MTGLFHLSLCAQGCHILQNFTLFRHQALYHCNCGWKLRVFLQLGIANDSVTDLGVLISDFSYIGLTPRYGISESCGGLVFNCLRNLHIVSIAAALFCIPTKSAQRFEQTFHFISKWPINLGKCAKLYMPSWKCKLKTPEWLK